MKTEVLIVGDGLAATTLALHLFEKKVPFKVVGEFQNQNASTVAAGVCNPVVFRRLNPSWKIHTLLDYCKTFYNRFEKQFNSDFLREIQIQKLIRTNDEIDFWRSRINDPKICDFIDLEENPKTDDSFFHPYLGLGISHGIKLDTSIFLGAIYEWLSAHNLVITEKLYAGDLTVDKNLVRWLEIEAENIVFCEGHTITGNPYFSYLPMKPVKGEVLIVEMKGLNLTNVVHDKISICPLGHDQYWVGATYNWDDLHMKGTEEGKQFLLASLKNIVKNDFRIVSHLAGIRPAIADRRPIIGRHPKHRNMWVFNGLGTKGTLQAPWVAEQLVNYMLEEIEPPSELNSNRFDRLLAD